MTVGLYLCIFDEDDELEGVEVGSYEDFAFFRSTVSDLLENGKLGTKYPTLLLHSDCEGEWTPDECSRLRDELRSITTEFRRLPPKDYHSEWQKSVADLVGLNPATLYDTFIDVDGEPLLERLEGLCDISIREHKPILFQ